VGIKDLIKGRLDMYMVDPETLIEDKGWNVRISGPDLDEHVRWLADSIKEEGVKEPLTCYILNDKLHVTNGHCRLKAVALAKSEGAEIVAVPVRLEDRYSKAEDRVLSLITRNSGKSLNQLEMGQVFKKLLKYGWSVAEVAKKCSFSGQYVRNILTLAGSPTEVTDMVKDGKVSATTASKVINEEGVQATEVLQQAIKGAEDEGKVKATQKDIDKVKIKKKKVVPWKTYGPRLYDALKLVYDEIPNNPDYPGLFGDYTFDAGLLLSEIKDKYFSDEIVESKQQQQQLPE